MLMLLVCDIERANKPPLYTLILTIRYANADHGQCVSVKVSVGLAVAFTVEDRFVCLGLKCMIDLKWLIY